MNRDINPHIPQYISAAPWYIDATGPTLKHQRPQEKPAKFANINEYYVRGQKGQTATKYRKGACENCGAITHKKKDCLDRPRKIGAKYTQESIAPDEQAIPDLQLDYDGKRDRWAGFDPTMYKKVVDEYAKVEDAKRQLKEEKMKQEHINSENKEKAEGEEGGGDEEAPDSDSDADPEDDKYADHLDMPGTKVDSKQRITVRNLRIREDTAKYLRNLKPDSAYYDPKTRTMRDNPYKDSREDAPDMYAGENFVRFSGDTLNVADVQKFSWQAHDRGVDIHLQAEPTKAELLHKEFKVKQGEIKESVKVGILERYGGAEHLEAPPKELIFAQTENYVEYSRQGRITKGAEKAPVKSVYEEDVMINNHSAVWGSFWVDGKWGFRCCHSLIKNSYCTGAAGREALSESANILLLKPSAESSAGDVGHDNDRTADDKAEDAEQVTQLSKLSEATRIHPDDAGSLKTEESEAARESSRKRKNKKKKASKKKRKRASSSSSSSDEEDEEETRKKKIREALTKEQQRKFEEIDERKRNYNSMYDHKAPTEEEIEAYHLNHKRDEDPMQAFL